MDLKLIRNLLRLMERGDVTELEIDDEKEGLRVHLRRGKENGPVAPVVMMGGGGSSYAQAPPPAPFFPVSSAETAATVGRDPSLREIQSPMVGTYYRASSPDSEPFVSVGQRVDEETTVCIIEAMKVMNEIKAELRGEVVEILVENGEPVEFGQPLLLVRRS